MAYIRQRGNQLALVHGVRDAETGEVRQHILFTLFSKPEALEAIGRGPDGGKHRFQHLVEHAHPEVRFNWKQITSGIEANLHILPDEYEYRETRLLGRFRPELLAFVRQLLVADPQSLDPAADVLEEHAEELRYVKDLIDWRLLCLDHHRKRAREAKAGADSETSTINFGADNRFFWRFALPYHRVPSDAEESVSEAYEKGDHTRLRALVGMLLELFPDYADGWNYLGLAAYDASKLEDARRHFEKTIEVGRTLLPRGVRKSQFWSVLDTRPYMRGLRNLGLTLIRLGRNDECLALADRLENECGDVDSATHYRAYSYLNLGQAAAALAAAEKLRGLDPGIGFVSAFAAYELGRPGDAVAALLHASLNHPRAASRLFMEKRGRATSFLEYRDDETGWSNQLLLGGYLGTAPARNARRFLRGVLETPAVAKLIADIATLRQRVDSERAAGRRDAFDALLQMQSARYATDTAKHLFAPMWAGAAGRPPARRPPRRPAGSRPAVH